LTKCTEEKFACKTENVGRHGKCHFTSRDASIVRSVSGDSALGREFSDDDEVNDPAEQDRIATELPS
jgi:hypothetical protein